MKEVWLVLASDMMGIRRVYGFTREDDARRFACEKDKEHSEVWFEVSPLRLDNQDYVS